MKSHILRILSISYQEIINNSGCKFKAESSRFSWEQY